jgi:tRNA threonylcarbamoyladenosine biosynthesis protein TsaE
MLKKISKSAKQTQEFGEKFAEKILLSRTSLKTAVVLALHGNLGAGKTCFLQGFAKGLKIKENILSPTYVIYKKFEVSQCPIYIKRPAGHFICKRVFYHFDCYRINKPEEILELGFKQIISNPKNIVAIEWPEKIKKILPKGVININFKFVDKNKREIIINF